MSADEPSITPATRRVRSALRPLLDALRGALIGITEIIPGISGGTVALIIGVYVALIDGAGHLARAAVRVVTDGFRGRGLARAGAHVRAVRWAVVLPVGFGMLGGIFLGARLIAPLTELYPVETRAVLTGLIAASLLVPIRMAGGNWRWRELAIAVVAAGVAFALTSFPASGDVVPPLPLVGLAAAVAVCALVLPGVSGSYLLLTVGMYYPTTAALSSLDLPYIASFVLGAILGLALFVPVLQWLLSNRRRITLVIMTGLMAGSLRAVWPWQSEANELLAPASGWPMLLLLIAIGAAVVLGLIAAETALTRRRLMSQPVEAEPDPDVAIEEKDLEIEFDTAERPAD